MGSKNISRRFARRAQHQFNPFNSKQPHSSSDTHVIAQPDITPIAKRPTPGAVHSIPNTQYPVPIEPNTQYPRPVEPSTKYPAPTPRRYYVQKHRDGKKTISTYIGINGAAPDIELIDRIQRQARLEHHHIAKMLIAGMKRLHTTNENAFNAVEAHFITAMTASGYHRIGRHPWSKKKYGPPDTRSQCREANTAPQALTPSEAQTPGAAQTPRIALTPVMIARAQKCRAHIRELEELFNSANDLGQSTTACRIYDRYIKRAVNRLAAAEKSLQTLESIATRQEAE